jgi:endonuclease YncB( thermonuclease family)
VRYTRRRVNGSTLAAVVGLVMVLAGCPRAASTEIAGVASVRDGDSLEIGGRKVRLHGVDAVEGGQTCTREGVSWRCGQAAANALADHLGRRPVICQVRTRDAYGRYVADCTVGGENVNRWLVREGWALAYRRYSTAYVDDENAARAAKRGIWQSEFTPPWTWREDHRRAAGPAATSDPPGDCRIKGNVNLKRQRIYHLPGDPDYDATRIDPRRGERWFCTEAEARAAGWRPPRP